MHLYFFLLGYPTPLYEIRYLYITKIFPKYIKIVSRNFTIPLYIKNSKHFDYIFLKCASFYKFLVDGHTERHLKDFSIHFYSTNIRKIILYT